jgi:hypothetical protein
MMSTSRRIAAAVTFMLSAAMGVMSLARSVSAQTTVGTGSIVGTVSDPSDVVGSGADVTITNLATGQIIHLSTNSSGTFNSGALIPGDYTARIAATTSIRSPGLRCLTQSLFVVGRSLQ